jgi:hypothetical protein
MKNDYDAISEYVDSMNNMTLANHLEFIRRGHIPDYNYTYEEDDYEAYELHMIILKIIKKLESEGE